VLHWYPMAMRVSDNLAVACRVASPSGMTRFREFCGSGRWGENEKCEQTGGRGGDDWW
jgi:hypothetical protein